MDARAREHFFRKCCCCRGGLWCLRAIFGEFPCSRIHGNRRKCSYACNNALSKSVPCDALLFHVSQSSIIMLTLCPARRPSSAALTATQSYLAECSACCLITVMMLHPGFMSAGRLCFDWFFQPLSSISWSPLIDAQLQK